MPNQLENVVSKGAGAIKAVKARIEGLTGVFAHLAREHAEVTTLLLRVKASSEPRVREELFPKIRMELLSHEKGELSEVYPAFRMRPGLVDFAEEHEGDAEKLEQQIALLAETEFADADWPERFNELVEMVSRHVKEEEEIFFPEACDAFGREESDRLLERYEAAKAEAIKGDHR